MESHENQRKVCLHPQLSTVTAAFVRFKSLLEDLAVSKVANIGVFHILKLVSSAPRKCHERPKSPHDFWMFAVATMGIELLTPTALQILKRNLESRQDLIAPIALGEAFVQPNHTATSLIQLGSRCLSNFAVPPKLSHHLWTVVAAASPAPAERCHCVFKTPQPCFAPKFPHLLESTRTCAHTNTVISLQMHLRNVYSDISTHMSHTVYRISYMFNYLSQPNSRPLTV